MHTRKGRGSLRRAGALLVLMLAACGGSDRRPGADAAAVPEAERYGGTAVWGAFTDMESMSPLTGFESNDLQVQAYVLLMPLVRLDQDLRPMPWLAERWDTVRVGPDTLELTFHLRRDVHWHDGVPTTAEDVKFTYERMRDPRVGFPRTADFRLYSPEAEVLDPYTIRFRLRPHAGFLEAWLWNAIAPRHILGNVPPQQLLNHPFNHTRPVGNGPFRFVRRIPNQEWIFEANPDFPEALGGRPYLDRLVFRVVPDRSALLTEVLTGSVDVAEVRPAHAERITAASGVRLLSFATPIWIHIAWNTRLPMFRDARVRRALSLALDRRAITEAVMYGYAEVGRSPVTPMHWSYDPNDSEVNPPYDPDAARRLLAEAGWHDRDGNGVLEDAQGREFRFTMRIPARSEVPREISEIVQAQLRRVGVAMTLQILEKGTVVSQVEGTAGERDFEATIWDWYDHFEKDDSDKLHSRSMHEPFGFAGYSNPRADWLMDTLKVTLDREVARPLWKEYQRLMVREAPVTVLFYPHRPFAVRERLQGVEMDGRGELVTVTEWWIAPRER